MAISQTTEREALREQLDILRQMLLLSVGASHPTYCELDAAWRSCDLERMQRAIDAFDQLPEAERIRTMGWSHMDDMTGTD